jgi:hypothetical protein
MLRVQEFVVVFREIVVGDDAPFLDLYIYQSSQKAALRDPWLVSPCVRETLVEPLYSVLVASDTIISIMFTQLGRYLILTLEVCDFSPF